MIALNSTQEAEGELYVDDGRSFEFAQGAYIHRRFTFSDGKLTSIKVPPASPGKARFSSECIIERIILVGYHPAKPRSALIEPSNQKVDIELGPLLIRPGEASAVAATVRKPDVPIAGDWTITIL